MIVHLRLFTALLLLTVIFWVGGCKNKVIGDTGGEIPRNLAEARELWESRNIRSYTVDVEQICFCGGPRNYRMTVVDEEVVEVVDLQSGSEVGQLDPYNTISEWFDWLEQYAVNDPIKLELKFDDRYGFPIFVDYDQSREIVDEELNLTMENFVIQ